MKNKIEKNGRKLPESFFKQIIENRYSKYGQFIIQTNEVQLLLVFLILLKALPSRELKYYLERSTLGNLINSFRICANSSELCLIRPLEKYNAARNALAHKMYSKKKLTEKECELSIELGEEILEVLTLVLGKEFLW